MKRTILLALVLALTSISIVFFYYNPSMGLYSICISIGLITFAFLRKKRLLISILATITTFFALEEYATKNQAEIILHEIFDYHERNGITPNDLNEIFQCKMMYLTPLFKEYYYERKNETKKAFDWKLEFSTVTGTIYFYDDKSGDIENQKNGQGNNHLNNFIRHK